MNIIVAGASRGIGYEVVKALAGQGSHKVLAVSRNRQKLKALKQECINANPETKVLTLGFDVERDDVNGKFLPYVLEELHTVDQFIYNAGFLVNKPFSDLSVTDFDRSINVNVKGAFAMIKALFPLFNKNSHILTISSMGGFQGSAKFPGLSLYSASKGALAVMTECLAEEFKDRSIKCNCLALGAVQTEMLAEAFPGYAAPLAPKEMAEFIADFSLNGHKYFNGKILPVSLSTP